MDRYNEFWTFHQMNRLGNLPLAVWILGKLYPGILQSCSIKTWNLVILHSSHSSKFPSCTLTIMQCDSTANILSWNLPILHSYDLERLSCKKLSWNQVWIVWYITSSTSNTVNGHIGGTLEESHTQSQKCWNAKPQKYRAFQIGCIRKVYGKNSQIDMAYFSFFVFTSTKSTFFIRDI